MMAALSPESEKREVRLGGTVTGVVHSFAEEEKVAFVQHINSTLGSDPDLSTLIPINEENDDLFEACKDGVLLCKMINIAQPGTIFEKAINKNCATVHKRVENLNLAIGSAKAIGCNIVNMGATDFLEGKPHLLLGMIWQVIKQQLLANVSLRNCPELVVLLKEGEELADLLKASSEEILLRWVNYHLARSGSSKQIKNFSADIKDSEAYTILLTQIAPAGTCDMSPLREDDHKKRAELMLQGANKMGCRKFVNPQHVVSGNQKLNLAFVATLFNANPALQMADAKVAVDMAGLDIDEGDSREERAFRNWMNSLGNDHFVNNLFSDANDGTILLETLDKIEPGCVDWKKVNKDPKMVFKKVENCNYVVEVCKKLGFHCTNIGGKDVSDGNKKLILGLVWQAMRHHTLGFLNKLTSGDGKKVSEPEMIAWANAEVTGTGSDLRMASFNDSSLKNGLFFMNLLKASEPSAINWEIVTKGETPEDCEINAKYVLSVARKINCTIFLLWEDIVDVKPKMLTTLVGSIMARTIEARKGRR